jgi:MoxR-like ATPase
MDISQINDFIKEKSSFTDQLISETSKVIVGQRYMIERLICGILARGHILIEGIPGLAKTLTIKTMAAAMDCSFQRIQFTPDLLPADLIGTMIYNQKDGEFKPRLGPIFTNILLADEINRAPAKVQSALLEAMQEKQVTLGKECFKLEEPFIVMATQNPIEQEGTYPLPEAQVDRFMMKLKVIYPSKAEEMEIINRMVGGREIPVGKVITRDSIVEARSAMDRIYVDEKIKKYVLDLVFATREPGNYRLKELENLIEYGASPRASICLTEAAKANAFINHRGYVTPEDIKAIGMDVLRHRIIISYEAEAEEVKTEDIVKMVFDRVEVP